MIFQDFLKRKRAVIPEPTIKENQILITYVATEFGECRARVKYRLGSAELISRTKSFKAWEARKHG